MQTRIIITAAFAALALAVPAAQARMEESQGAGSGATTSYATPAFAAALAARNEAEAGFDGTVGGATRPDDRSGVRGVGTDTGFVPGVTDFPTVRVDARAVDGAPAPSGIDWRELGFSGAAVLALIALFATRMRSRHDGATSPATLSS